MHFVRGGTEWKFEVEVNRGTMRISKEQEIQQASGGTYPVGGAAQVTFQASGNMLTLGTVRPNPGWRVTKQDERSDEIEIDFARNARTAEFDAEASGSAIRVEIDEKLIGPIPNQ